MMLWLFALLLLSLCTAQEYPDVRFTNWENLDSRRLPRSLNYDRASWNNVGSLAMEQRRYDNLEQQEIVDELVPDAESWDCYIK